MITEDLGKRIRELRQQTWLSQEKFALKIGMGLTYFASVEDGKEYYGMNSNQVYDVLKSISDTACEKMNEFSANVLKTRGGRIGSGMGTLLEALWGYMMNQIILQNTDLDCEIAWFPDNQYNDFSCIKKIFLGTTQLARANISE